MVSVSNQRASRIVKADINARLIRFLRNRGLDPKSVKVISRSCGCSLAAPDDLDGSWGRCFKGCLADVGVSPVQVILCGAACAAAVTGAGAIVCAICVGVDITVIEVCALGCLAYPDGYGKPGGRGIILTKNLKPKPSRLNASAQRVKV